MAVDTIIAPHICPGPGAPMNHRDEPVHVWQVDNLNVGTCSHCEAVRSFAPRETAGFRNYPAAKPAKAPGVFEAVSASPAIHTPKAAKPKTPKATRVCCGCKIELSTERFNKDKRRNDGLDPYCKACRKEQQANYHRNRMQRETPDEAQARREKAARKMRALRGQALKGGNVARCDHHHPCP